MQQDLQPILVYTSCDDRLICRDIAGLVLEKRLAACVQVMAPMTSFYWWEDRIASDNEYLVTMKSDGRLFDELVKAIRSIHPYEVPEIIAAEIVAVDADYCRWMKESLRHG